MLTVHLRVADGGTGRPTPARISVTGPGGEYYPPAGMPAEVPLGRGEAVGGSLRLGSAPSSYIDGGCEIRLPAGVPLGVVIRKGPEYRPARERVTLGPGQISLRFALERWSDVRQHGYLPGDTRCHFLSPHDALIEGLAEDLDFVNLLATPHHVPGNDGQMYPTAANLLAFSGRGAALTRDGCQVVVNTHNAHPALGRLSLLDSHRPVHPLSFGRDDPDDWSLEDWCDQCHRKGGLVVWADAFRSEAGLPGGEALPALILGKVDAVEFDSHARRQPLLPWWYRLLAAGLRAPAAGGSGRDGNRVALGGTRTYALVEGEPTYAGWVEAVRVGRTFVTNGPLPRLTVNGLPPGSTVEAGPAEVRVEASSAAPFDRVELVVNGDAVAAGEAAVAGEFDLPDGGWVAARCLGAGRSALQPSSPVFAHTSPVWVGPTPARDPAAVAALAKLVRDYGDWVRETGRFTDEKYRGQHLDRCRRALAALGDPPA